MTVGLKIKLLRTEKNLTQAELCDLTGLSSSTLVSIEKNRKKAQVETLIRLNNVLTNGDEKVLLELIELNERK
ncbi:MAG: helix-turn-helix transcriptional regulator [Acholeplasmataceae bacterium]